MKSLKTTGIILKRTDFGEADRLLTIFSFDQGKIRALAKGVRKPLSKLGGHLEPCSMTDFQLAEGRSFYVVTGADLQYPYADIRQTLSKMSVAYYVLEMVDALIVEEQAQGSAFNLLSEALVMLEAAESEMVENMIAPSFALKLLADLGYLPELNTCVSCAKVLTPEGNSFSMQLGGILCGDCQIADYTAQRLSANTIKIMRLLLDKNLEVLLRLTPDKSVVDELKKITENYLHYQSDREMRSLSFVRDLAR